MGVAVRVDDVLRLLAGPGVVGDELPWTLEETLVEAQLGRVEHWSEQRRVAVLIDDLWTGWAAGATSAILVVDGVTSIAIAPRSTPFVGGTIHFTIGVAAVRSSGPGLVIEIGAMMHAGDVAITGSRALLVTLADRTDRTDRTERDDAAPSLVDDLPGYLDWSLDLDREVDVLGWYEVRPER